MEATLTVVSHLYVLKAERYCCRVEFRICLENPNAFLKINLKGITTLEMNMIMKSYKTPLKPFVQLGLISIYAFQKSPITEKMIGF